MTHPLLPGLALLLLAAAPAHGSDRPPADACLAAAASDNGCYAPLAQESRDEVGSDGVLAQGTRQGTRQDHDRQGNAVDDRGRILAVPARAGRPHEVFTDD